MKVSKKSLTHNLFQKVLSIFLFRGVMADEGAPTEPATPPAPTTPPTTPPSNPTPTISFEALISQARKEEKDKLYPQINTLKTDKETLTQKLNNALLQVGEKENTIQELTKKLEKVEKGQVDSQEVKTLKEKVATLEAENNQLKGDAEKAKLDKFKETEIAKFKGEVIPELIMGTTEEEIVASVQNSNAKYKEIVQRVTGGAGAGTQVTGNPAPLANPSISGVAFDFKNTTPEMIAGMNATEYAKYRVQIGLK